MVECLLCENRKKDEKSTQSARLSIQSINGKLLCFTLIWHLSSHLPLYTTPGQSLHGKLLITLSVSETVQVATVNGILTLPSIHAAVEYAMCILLLFWTSWINREEFRLIWFTYACSRSITSDTNHNTSSLRPSSPCEIACAALRVHDSWEFSHKPRTA